jgi:hypothetical protein
MRLDPATRQIQGGWNLVARENVEDRAVEAVGLLARGTGVEGQREDGLFRRYARDGDWLGRKNRLANRRRLGRVRLNSTVDRRGVASAAVDRVAVDRGAVNTGIQGCQDEAKREGVWHGGYALISRSISTASSPLSA